jgi:hypothetical protein
MSALVYLSRVRRLAASSQPIQDLLIDTVRRSRTTHLAATDQDSNRSQGELRLDDEQDSDVVGAPDSDVLLPADEIAGAVLLGRALDSDRYALARLQDRDAFAVVEVPNADLVKPIASVLRQHVIGKEHTITGEGLGAKDVRLRSPGTVALFDDRGDTKKKDVSPDVVAAVESRWAALIVSAAPNRLLSSELLRLVNVRIGVPAFDTDCITAVIAAITGRHPGRIDAGLAANTTLNALKLAVRADLGSAESLARLVRLVGESEREFSTGLTLSELHGLGPAKEWGLNLAADLREYSAGRLPWSAVSGHAALLYGPPGTGKTSYARALARECGVAFIPTSYADWQSYKDGHLGSVTQAIRKVFAAARQKAPCILFIDEIDSLPARGTSTRHDEWWSAITNCLLEEFTNAIEGVIVIAACNHPDRLDPALVRSGRLDRRIETDVPGLIGIFRSHLGRDLDGADLLPAALAARGHTGADVERWVREARARARRRGEPLTIDLLSEIVREGAPALPDEVRRLVAFHEAGHAIANAALGVAKPVSLSIGAGGGGETNSVVEQTRLHTRGEMEEYLISMLAGRAAEEIACGATTAGAGGDENSDLARATMLALRLESVYGLGATGLAHIPGGPERLLLMDPHLLAAVQTSLDRAYAAAKDLLNAHRASLDALATALFERGYLDATEIETVLQSAPLARATSAAEATVGAQPSAEQTETHPGEAIEPDLDVAAVGCEPATS